jgi:hypothetical protein
MKTLIIHPADSSTSFLDIVYAPIENKTVITGGVSKTEVQKLIREHDRVMMMGHGSPGGLFNVGRFTNCGAYVIDQQMVPLLKEKDNSVFIWCNADKFVNIFGLKGFYSGMFISEVGEANYCSKYDQTVDDLLKIKLSTVIQEEVDESNYGFCNIIAKYINNDKDLIHENVKNEYGLIAETNPVALYNNNRLYKS